MNILIVDDELSVLKILSVELERRGHNPICVETGRQGCEMFDQNAVDMVFLDIALPDMSGIQVLEHIRRKTTSVPVVILSGKLTIEITIQALRLGAFDMMSKPGSITEFDAVINRVQSLLSLDSNQSTVKSVFLSHSHADKPFVRRLAKDLQSAGIFAWIDEAEIKVGDSLIQKLTDAIERIDYVAVILSQESVNSKWVKVEVEKAMNSEIKSGTIKVLPLLLETVDLPWFLDGKVYADFRTPDKYGTSFKALLDRLRE